MGVTIRPIRENILIKPDSGDEVSAGGIVVPEHLRGRANRGRVVAVGNGIEGKPMKYKPNNIVWHIKGAGIEMEENGEKFVLMPQGDVLAYLEN